MRQMRMSILVADRRIPVQVLQQRPILEAVACAAWKVDR